MVEELLPIERKWAKGWIHGLAELLASGPAEESPEEHKKEVEAIEKIALEKGALPYEYAKKWREKLLKILKP